MKCLIFMSQRQNCSGEVSCIWGNDTCSGSVVTVSHCFDFPLVATYPLEICRYQEFKGTGGGRGVIPFVLRQCHPVCLSSDQLRASHTEYIINKEANQATTHYINLKQKITTMRKTIMHFEVF